MSEIIKKDDSYIPCEPHLVSMTSEDYNKIIDDNLHLKKENEECLALLKYQHLRTREADELWCKENNSPNMMPDLGRLIEWLMKERQSLKERLRELVEIIKQCERVCPFCIAPTHTINCKLSKFLKQTEDLK